MSDDVVISVKNVSKCFEMYEKPVHRLYQTLCAGHKKFYKEFWALRDINFEVRRGECVGIIGRNGAGKSTILQIITGTLAPTTGSVELKGRVAALLELGSGFNPEFTGRENVYLNGSVLGLTRREIDERYDDIAAFADIGEFIDQPVKTYSSGMVVRLAFAVNVFVDPEILIVDEALAVGDLGFQMRCFQRLKELTEKGTTLLFVTHDLMTVANYCRRVLFLQRGQQVVYSDDVVGTVSRYKESLRLVPVRSAETNQHNSGGYEYRFGTYDATIEKCEIFESLDATKDLSVIIAGSKYYFQVTINAKKEIPHVVMGVGFRNREGVDVWGENTVSFFPAGFHLKTGDNILTFETCFNANVGEYGITLGIADISVNPRVELDQRWPMRQVTVVSDHPCQGLCYGPWRLRKQR